MTDIQLVTIPTSRIDENGLVHCWSMKSSKWVKRSPIDVREGIANGSLALDKPGEEADKLPASKSEQEEWLSQMSKSKLRDLCIQNDVDHTGSDTKASLIKRLINSGVAP